MPSHRSVPSAPRLDTSRYSSALQSWESTSTSAYFFPWTWLSSSILHFNCRCAASLFLAMPIGNWRSPPIIFIILERDERGKSSLGNRSAFCAIFPKCRSLGSCGGGDNLVPRDWQGGGGGSTFKGAREVKRFNTELAVHNFVEESALVMGR